MDPHLRVMRVVLRGLAVPLGSLAAASLVASAVLTLWPAPLFPYEAGRGDIVLRSDRPLSAGVSAVIADVERRIASSDLPAVGPIGCICATNSGSCTFSGAHGLPDLAGSPMSG